MAEISSWPMVVSGWLFFFITGVPVPIDAWSPIAIDITCAAPWAAR